MRALNPSEAFGQRVRPEVELLVLCCASRIATLPGERIFDLLGAPIDWNAVCRNAERHGVVPLLYRYLSVNCPDRVPEPVLKGLKREFYANSLRNRHLARELVRLMASLESGGIPVLTHKGPALAVAAYGDIALRSFGDLDIVVRQADAEKAAELIKGHGYLQQSGYRLHANRLLRGLGSLASWLPAANADLFTNENGLSQVDLHWRLMPQYFAFAPDLESLWAGARRIALEDGSVLTPGTVDLMIVLCVNNSKHGWAGLSQVCDIAELIRANHDVDWLEVVERAQALGARRMVLLGFDLARRLLGAELPDGVVAMVRDDQRVTALATRVTRNLLRPWTDRESSAKPFLVPLLSIESTRRRMDYCLDRLLYQIPRAVLVGHSISARRPPEAQSRLSAGTPRG
jgi:hypothetical protein